MPQTVKIRLRNTGQTLSIPNGITLAELYQQSGLHIEYGPMCARVNNKNQGLGYRFYNSKDVEFLDIRSASGMRAYTRTLFLVLAKAVEDLYPQGRLIIGAAISGGYYCELRIGRQVTQDDAQSINRRMEQIIAADLLCPSVTAPFTNYEKSDKSEYHAGDVVSSSVSAGSLDEPLALCFHISVLLKQMRYFTVAAHVI